MTASGDDRNPVLRVWDLGASTNMPVATLSGHAAGIFKTSWCPHDDSLLLSTAKDHRTLLWDLSTGQAIAEIPNDQPDPVALTQKTSASNLFSSGGLTEQQKHMRYDVLWSPFKRGLALTCSLDKKVQVHTVLSLATKSGRPPAWMRPASSVSMGFGGTYVSCNSSAETSRYVVLDVVEEKPDLAKVSETTEIDVTSLPIVDFCRKQQEAAKPEDKELWGFMQVLFETDARQQQLLEHLGFSPEDIAAAANQYSNDLAKGVASMSVQNGDKNDVMSQATADMVKKTLVVGNFEAAVEYCFQTGNLADALMLAYCGGAELWSKTQQRFFESESCKRHYLSIVNGYLHSQFDELVAESDLKEWRETLAVLTTYRYGQAEEFPRLCVALGDRLLEAGRAQSASLCYMCALNLERSVEFWKNQYDRSALVGASPDLLALHEFVVKVSVFLQAAGATSSPLTEEVEQLFTKYAQALAEQGHLVTAAKYAQGSSEEGKMLRDRLYRSRATQRCYAVLGTAPEFPYTMTAVSTSRGQTVVSATREPQADESPYGEQQQQQEQMYEQQQHGYSASQQQSYSAQESGTSDQLPPGWIALQDPGSGMTYYANQSTGETTWDKPQEAPAPVPTTTPVPAPQQAAYSTTQTTTQDPLDTSRRSVHSASGTRTPTKDTLASKYGDGFVTSASHPELAQQYGNVATSNPYKGSSRPGTAAAVVQTRTATPPISGSMNFDSLALSDHHNSIKEILLTAVEALKSAPLNPVEKRQLGEAEKAIAILVKKLAGGYLSDDIVEKVWQLVTAVAAQDFATASTIQTSLANSEWREQKDWLKGIKILIALASKLGVR
jgi:protein transport protein SEC31